MESTFDCYTPLERPTVVNIVPVERVDPVRDLEDGECETDESSDGDSSENEGLKPSRTILNPRRKRIIEPPQASSAQVAPRQKYDIWSAKLREDSLTETMRNFGVNRDEGENRSVEWYDFTLGNRFAKDGTNRLKRRRSFASRETDDRDEDDSNDQMDFGGKRFCLNNRNDRNSSSPQNNPRNLDDLELPDNYTIEELAKELSSKLKEKNEQLILQITKTVGDEIVQKTFAETQKIELEGGMMIMNGRRRRTSGGVFLFLIKHSDEISEERKKEAFTLENCTESSKRDEEIEELKKTLITNDKGSPTLRPKIELLKPQDTISTTLSNPPPSPVAYQEEDIFNNNNNSEMDFN